MVCTFIRSNRDRSWRAARGLVAQRTGIGAVGHAPTIAVVLCHAFLSESFQSIRISAGLCAERTTMAHLLGRAAGIDLIERVSAAEFARPVTLAHHYRPVAFFSGNLRLIGRPREGNDGNRWPVAPGADRRCANRTSGRAFSFPGSYRMRIVRWSLRVAARRPA
jgi:hypothetical protein